MSATELQTSRDKGLCYTCDEQYRPGHKCQKPFMLFTASPEIFETFDKQNPDLTQFLTNLTQPVEPSSEEHPDHIEAQISFHALMGHSIPRTLRVQARVGKSDEVVLVDGGCTHNFI
ncbi:hypothetical protein L6164_037321 [Bauhinia variegata]|uniref:Uncharacterized protein n=1 Tax=Bauhinia variegata TaxID=167791 RepID=A0ACB9KJR9_BAUVA|nr:hypothetical protein L6164_037321 [Bauhinia variegata]